MFLFGDGAIEMNGIHKQKMMIVKKENIQMKLKIFSYWLMRSVQVSAHRDLRYSKPNKFKDMFLRYNEAKLSTN